MTDANGLPDPAGLAEAGRRYGLANPGLGRINIHQVNLYIGGGCNRAFVSFRRPDGKIFYPGPWVDTSAGLHPANHGDQVSGGMVRGDAVAALYYGINPGETLFVGDKANHSKPIWSFGATMMLPYSLSQVASEFHTRDVSRKYSGAGSTPRPYLKLWENYLEGEVVRTRFFLNHQLTAAELKTFACLLQFS